MSKEHPIFIEACAYQYFYPVDLHVVRPLTMFEIGEFLEYKRRYWCPCSIILNALMHDLIYLRHYAFSTTTHYVHLLTLLPVLPVVWYIALLLTSLVPTWYRYSVTTYICLLVVLLYMYILVQPEQCFCPAAHIHTCTVSSLQCCCTCGIRMYSTVASVRTVDLPYAFNYCKSIYVVHRT